MKFYVIRKPHGVESVEAEKIENVSYEGDAFMVVAADSVNYGEIYQAIQISENKVLINYKRGHRYVEAKSIREALSNGGDTTVEYADVLFTGVHGEDDRTMHVELPATINTPTVNNYVDNGVTYEFDYWTDGSKEYAANESVNVTGDVTFTAHYTAKTITATFDAVNLGINEVVTANKGKVTVPTFDETYTNTNDSLEYTIDGWSSPDYNDGATVTSGETITGLSSNIVFNAITRRAQQ